MYRTLIVARFDPSDADAVAEIFTESDATELPHLLGASSRTLFRFHGLYLHLIEAKEELGQSVMQIREHPLFRDVNTKLGKHIRPYDPEWENPRDAMAVPFYRWDA